MRAIEKSINNCPWHAGDTIEFDGLSGVLRTTSTSKDIFAEMGEEGGLYFAKLGFPIGWFDIPAAELCASVEKDDPGKCEVGKYAGPALNYKKCVKEAKKYGGKHGFRNKVDRGDLKTIKKSCKKISQFLEAN